MTSDLFGDIDKLIEGKPLVAPNVTSGRIQLERAPNAVQFIECERFLGSPELFPEQYNIVRDFFELLCPFCNDVPRIVEKDDVLREDQILFEFNRCPECGLRKFDLAEQLSFHDELIGVAGQRSGKSVIAGEITAAYTHDIICTENLHTKLNIIKSEFLDGTFVASAKLQADETVWAKFKGFYDDSPWFQQYKKALLDLEIADRDLRRGDLYWETTTGITIKDKRLRFRSRPSNSASLAGKTGLFTVIDELARLDSGDSKQSATEVYRVLNRSLLTIRSAVNRLREKGIYEVPSALMLAISSPIYSEDKSMSLLKQAPGFKKMFCFHKATWEMNPHIKREDLDDEYEKDPVGAERDYAANPPGAENPFVKDLTRVDMAIDQKKNNIFELRESFFEEIVEKNGMKLVRQYVTVEVLNFRFNNLTRYGLHCDAGKSNDSFCLAIGHRENDTCVIDGGIEVRPIPKNAKTNTLAREVYFPAMVNIVLKINGLANILIVTYDHWNSTDQIQRLVGAKIIAIEKNINRDEHVAFLNGVNSGKVILPAKEEDNIDPKIIRNVPCAKAIWELVRLNDNGKKVDHPRNASNDMIQCYVGVHRNLMSMTSQDINNFSGKQRAKANFVVPKLKIGRMRR